MLNVFLGLVLILGIYLGPMYFVGRWFAYAGIWLAAAMFFSICSLLAG